MLRFLHLVYETALPELAREPSMSAANRTRAFDLIVHIGTGKTGSSSIQKSLSANQARLGEHHVRYLGLMGEETTPQRYPWQIAGGWPELAKLGTATAQQQLGQLLSELVTELRDGGYHAAIWSNETIFGNGAIVIPILERLQADGVSVKIIAYVRRHDAWAHSAYLQWGVKHKTNTGPVMSFREWYSSRQVRFASGLDIWLEREWSQLSVRNFDACADVVADFLDHNGLHHPGTVIRRENETPNAVVLALWALFNSQFDEQMLPIHLQRVLKRAGLLEHSTVDVDFLSLLPDQEDIDRVREDCAEDRQRLDAILARFGQPPIEISPLAVRRMQVTQNQINAALLLIIKQQSDELTRLHRRLDRIAPDNYGETD